MGVYFDQLSNCNKTSSVCFDLVFRCPKFVGDVVVEREVQFVSRSAFRIRKKI